MDNDSQKKQRKKDNLRILAAARRANNKPPPPPPDVQLNASAVVEFAVTTNATLRAHDAELARTRAQRKYDAIAHLACFAIFVIVMLWKIYV